MLVWTIQTQNVLTVLRSGRTWRAVEAHDSTRWPEAYGWMQGEMAARLGPPTVVRQMPVWLWCQWRGQRRRRPDLRNRGHLPQGSAGVRIELELADDRVLRSDFDLWHYALNGWYLPESPADENKFDACPDRCRIAPSWRRIFDLEWHDRRYTVAREEKSIQGVTWELRPEDVRGATAFTAR